MYNYMLQYTYNVAIQHLAINNFYVTKATCTYIATFMIMHSLDDHCYILCIVCDTCLYLYCLHIHYIIIIYTCMYKMYMYTSWVPKLCCILFHYLDLSWYVRSYHWTDDDICCSETIPKKIPSKSDQRWILGIVRVHISQ